MAMNIILRVLYALTSLAPEVLALMIVYDTPQSSYTTLKDCSLYPQDTYTSYLRRTHEFIRGRGTVLVSRPFHLEQYTGGEGLLPRAFCMILTAKLRRTVYRKKTWQARDTVQ